MQSMNMGLMEADLLAATLSDVLEEKAPLGHLERYDNQCRTEWQQLLGLGKKGAPRPGTANWVRERTTRLLPCIPGAGEDLVQLAAQLGLEL
jgi:2-polyprenyl-6-methoxyphenol hydroxylase-like FAD-dependent oxidoreductase